MTTGSLVQMVVVRKKPAAASSEIDRRYDRQRGDPVPPNPISRQWRRRALPAGKGKSGRRNGSPWSWPSSPLVGCRYTSWIACRCLVARRAIYASPLLSYSVTSTPPLTLFSTHIPIRSFPQPSAECWSSDRSLPVPRTVRQLLRQQLRCKRGQSDESLDVLCIKLKSL